MSLDEIIELLQQKRELYNQILELNESIKNDVWRLHSSLREINAESKMRTL